MEIETVHTLLVGVALAHPKEGDSDELRALRQIAAALLQIAKGIHEVHQTQAAMLVQRAG
jgi:hypothetical protein